MKTSTMNPRLLLTSAAVVLAAMGCTEVLKPAQARAVGHEIAAVQRQASATALSGLGLNLDPAFKKKVIEHLNTSVKDAKQRGPLITLLNQLDTGSPTGDKVQEKSWDQLASSAAQDVAKLKRTGGSFTSNLSDYLANKDRDVYVAMPKMAEQLNRGWGTIVTPPGSAFDWTMWGKDMAVNAANLDWQTALAQLAGMTLPGQLFAPAWSMYQAALAGDWVAFSLALIALQGVWIALAIPAAGPILAIGLLIVSMIWEVIKSFLNAPSWSDIVSDWRNKRDDAWKEQVKKRLTEDIVPQLRKAFVQSQQDGAYATAVGEALIDARRAAPGLSAQEQKALREAKADIHAALPGKLKEFTDKANITFADMALDLVKNAATDTSDLVKQPFKDKFASLTQAGIGAPDALVPVNAGWDNATPGTKDQYWLFFRSGGTTKVAKVKADNAGGVGAITVLEGPKPVKDTVWKNAFSQPGVSADWTARGWVHTGRGDRNQEVFLLLGSPGTTSPGKTARVNVNSGAVHETFDTKAGFHTDVEPLATVKADVSPAGNQRTFAFSSGKTQMYEISSKTFQPVGTWDNKDPYFSGLNATDMPVGDIRALVKIPGTDTYFVFDKNGDVTKTVFSGTANGPSTWFGTFTNNFLNGIPSSTNLGPGWFQDNLANLKRELFRDDVKTRMPSDSDLRKLVPAQDFKPITIPPLIDDDVTRLPDAVVLSFLNNPQNPAAGSSCLTQRNTGTVQPDICDNSAKQKWKIVKLGDNSIQLVNDNRYLDHNWTSHEVQTTTTQFEGTKWKVQLLGSNIRLYNNGYYLSVNTDHGTVIKAEKSAWDWTIKDTRSIDPDHPEKQRIADLEHNIATDKQNIDDLEQRIKAGQATDAEKQQLETWKQTLASEEAELAKLRHEG